MTIGTNYAAGLGMAQQQKPNYHGKASTDSFGEAIQNFKKKNELKAQEIKEEDWREMSDDEWDKWLGDVDEYIDAFKEQLRQMKEIQDEAARKAAMSADSDMRTTAASSAALNALANGFVGASEGSAEEMDTDGVVTENGVKREKNWTKLLNTDDQTVLRTAKAAQNAERTATSRFLSIEGKNNMAFPYSSLANGGLIEYNGVIFVGDSQTNSINLGDMSDKNRVMHIQLSGGGFLNVNYDNIGDLKNAIGMFSGKDKGIILKAIASDVLQGAGLPVYDKLNNPHEKIIQVGVSKMTVPVWENFI